MKYKKELKPTEVEKPAAAKKFEMKSEDIFILKTAEGEPAVTTTTVATVPRFYTCPLDQVQQVSMFRVLSAKNGVYLAVGFFNKYELAHKQELICSSFKKKPSVISLDVF
jgi:hypothetical protein